MVTTKCYIIDESLTIDENIKFIKHKEWIQAMQFKSMTFDQNGTWIFQDLPKGKKKNIPNGFI
jgi:hypothetical protein